MTLVGELTYFLQMDLAFQQSLHQDEDELKKALQHSLQQRLKEIEELFDQPRWVIEERIFQNNECRAFYLRDMMQEAKHGFEEKCLDMETTNDPLGIQRDSQAPVFLSQV